MSKENLSDIIKKELLKSGFPLELSCRKAIYKSSWATILSRYYLDDADVEHEIDLLAYQSSKIKKNAKAHHVISSTLIGECKKNSSNHWVFFYDDLSGRMLNISSTLRPEGHELIVTAYSSRDSVLKDHHYFKMVNCSSYCMAFKNSNEKNQIFDGLQQLFGAYKHIRKTHEYYMKERGDQGGIWTHAYYPVLVFDGRLFASHLVGEELDVKEVNHILYSGQHPSYLDAPITVDVVCADFFPDYLKLLEKDHEAFCSYINSKTKVTNRRNPA